LRAQGYVAQLTPWSGDEGIDVIAQKGAERIVVQCKKQAKKVTPRQVREFCGAVQHADASSGKFFTTASFSEQAKEFAVGEPIELIDGDALLLLLKDLAKS